MASFLYPALAALGLSNQQQPQPTPQTALGLGPTAMQPQLPGVPTAEQEALQPSNIVGEMIQQGRARELQGVYGPGKFGGDIPTNLLAAAAPLAMGAISGEEGEAGSLGELAELKPGDFVAPHEALSPEPGYVYHGTNLENAHDIARSGNLEIHKPNYQTDQEVWPDGGTEKRSYWSSEPATTRYFTPEHGQPVVLRAPQTASKFSREGTGDIFTRQPVAANKLEILTQKGWQPVARLSPEAKPEAGGSAAVAELEGKYPVSASDPSKRSLIAMGREVGTFQVTEREGRLRLQHIETKEKGQGVGNLLLNRITRVADRHGVPLELTASPFGEESERLDQDQLRAFYAKHGFEMEPGYDPSLGYMIRYPKVTKK